LLLRPELAELQQLACWVEGIAQSAALASDELFALQLCVEEAVANIIKYGGLQSSSQEIAVNVTCGEQQVVAIVEDGGRYFDPTQVPPPSKPKSLDEAMVGKLGVHLMRSFATDMSYELHKGRNRLTFRFTRAKITSRPEP
jgi:serine/threonine-protein kinase RsbW